MKVTYRTGDQMCTLVAVSVAPKQNERSSNKLLLLLGLSGRAVCLVRAMPCHTIPFHCTRCFSFLGSSALHRAL